MPAAIRAQRAHPGASELSLPHLIPSSLPCTGPTLHRTPAPCVQVPWPASGTSPPRSQGPQEGAAGLGLLVSRTMPRIDADLKLDFKDVLLRPKRSSLRSRAEVGLFESRSGMGYFPGWRRGGGWKAVHCGNTLPAFLCLRVAGVPTPVPAPSPPAEEGKASWFPARTGDVFKGPSWGLQF